MREAFFFAFGLVLGIITTSSYWLYEPSDLAGFLRTARKATIEETQEKQREEK